MSIANVQRDVSIGRLRLEFSGSIDRPWRGSALGVYIYAGPRRYGPTIYVDVDIPGVNARLDAWIARRNEAP